jgi:hypothetical protein
MDRGTRAVGFETMPQIEDLEIAATWDEIELEAALKGSAEAQADSAADTQSSLMEALHAVEALQKLPKAERKQRAEELLRTLTSAPAPESLEPHSAPDAAAALPAEEPPSVELLAALPETSTPPTDEPPTIEPVATLPENVTPPPDEPSSAGPIAPDLVPETSASAEADPVPEAVAEASIVALLAPEAASALPASEPTPEAGAGGGAVDVAAERDAIPKFLATECASFEADHPDSLIPFRTAVAACVLIGAVLLVYFWTSQEFGVAARTLVGMSALSDTRPVPRDVPPSLAVRQAFVAPPPVYSAAAEAVRSYRPPFVGFDFLDDAAPAAGIKSDAPPPIQTALAVPQSSAEESAQPPTQSSDVTALIQRADALLKAGDIVAARAAYERAAAGGNPKAQIGVGKTYDPLVLAKLGTRGVRGDPVQAASWYARAGESGNAEGQQRLHALISGLSDCMLAQGTCAARKP